MPPRKGDGYNGIGRQRVQFSMYRIDIKRLAELVEIEKGARTGFDQWSKVTASGVVCELIEKGLAAKKLELAADAEIAAANERTAKAAALAGDPDSLQGRAARLAELKAKPKRRRSNK